MSSVMRVSDDTNRGMGFSGLTRVSNTTSISPADKVTTAISVTRSPRPGRDPVVSTSTTAKVQLLSRGAPRREDARAQRPSPVCRTRGSDPRRATATRSAIARVARAKPSTFRAMVRLSAAPSLRYLSARSTSVPRGVARTPVCSRLIRANLPAARPPAQRPGRA